jgi:hypothetical protein
VIGPYTLLSYNGYYPADFVTRVLPRHPYFILNGSLFQNGYASEDVPADADAPLSLAMGARIVAEPDPTYGGSGSPVSLPQTVIFDWGLDSVIS